MVYDVVEVRGEMGRGVEPSAQFLADGCRKNEYEDEEVEGAEIERAGNLYHCCCPDWGYFRLLVVSLALRLVLLLA
ncbi:unnamed protein product [Taenia asiatica]|uniref:Uncharacterized protein n=1 Tax=Taenia asiatica TaxID=60517 RepID=A0A0R3WGX9_TAEAS|nr:unnamed protein product [Taenia asiatica]